MLKEHIEENLFIFIAMLKRIYINVTQEIQDQCSKILELIDARDAESVYLGFTYLIVVLQELGVCMESDIVAVDEYRPERDYKRGFWMNDSLKHITTEDALRSVVSKFVNYPNLVRDHYWLYAITQYLAQGHWGVNNDEIFYFYRPYETT